MTGRSPEPYDLTPYRNIVKFAFGCDEGSPASFMSRFVEGEQPAFTKHAPAERPPPMSEANFTRARLCRRINELHWVSIMALKAGYRHGNRMHHVSRLAAYMQKQSGLRAKDNKKAVVASMCVLLAKCDPGKKIRAPFDHLGISEDDWPAHKHNWGKLCKLRNQIDREALLAFDKKVSEI